MQIGPIVVSEMRPDDVKMDWNIGDKIRSWRKISLTALSQETKRSDPTGNGISPAQISRIENGAVPDLAEVFILCRAMKKSVTELLGERPNLEPWFVVRHENVTAALAGDERFGHLQREGAAHAFLVEKHVYKYVPLDDDGGSGEFISQREREGQPDPIMRKFILEVGQADDPDIREGMGSHDGEEILYVLNGELDFWWCQPTAKEIERLILRKDDCIQYSSKLRHAYRASGTCRSAQALVVFSEPKVRMPVVYTESPFSPVPAASQAAAKKQAKKRSNLL